MANGPPDTNTRPRHFALLLGLTASAHELRRIGSNELLQVLPWRRTPAIVILVMKDDRHDLWMDRRHQRKVGGHAACLARKHDLLAVEWLRRLPFNGKLVADRCRQLRTDRKNAKSMSKPVGFLEVHRAEPAEAEACRN
jgi:hypothetical protein